MGEEQHKDQQTNKNTNKETKPVSETQSNDRIYNDIYHFVFDQSTDAILVSDLKGNLEEVNIGACVMLGYSKEELLRLNIKALIQSEDLTSETVWLAMIIAAKDSFMGINILRKDGSKIHVESNTRKTADDRIIVIARD